jgi:hypothetical protein
VNDVPRAAAQLSFIGSNLIYGTVSDAVQVEATGTFTSLATPASVLSQPVYDETDISAPGIPALVSGTNVLAIGVWNEAAPSTDLVLVPRLVLNQELEVIDRGDFDPPRMPLEDLDGEPRVADGDADGVPAPDTGADER